MSARNQGGKADTPALRRGGAASRQQDRSPLIALARSAGSCAATAFPCKPKQPAAVVRWLVATAVLARTDRRRFPEVKPSATQVPAVRGSRASTGPSAARFTASRRRGGGVDARRAPRRGEVPQAPNPAGYQPRNLFQSPGGLTMAKPAPSFFYDQPKSVPLGGFCKTTHGKPKSDGKSLIHKRYTLCEVFGAKRQSVPPPEPAFLRRLNRPVSGTSQAPFQS